MVMTWKMICIVLLRDHAIFHKIWEELLAKFKRNLNHK